MHRIGTGLFALFVVATLAFFGWWGYTITRSLPTSGQVVDRHAVLVKNALIYTVCVDPPTGKTVCRSVNRATWASCAPGANWPDCKETQP